LRPIIHSVKHYVQMTLTEATTLTRNTEVLVQAEESTAANLGNEVEEGALVKAVFIELWIEAESNSGFFTIIVEKSMAGAAAPTFTQMTDLFSYPNKKNILYTTQGLTSNDGVGNPIPILRQWFKIPKGKQRFGLKDKIILSIASRGANNINYCGFATYKEYS